MNRMGHRKQSRPAHTRGRLSGTRGARKRDIFSFQLLVVWFFSRQTEAIATAGAGTATDLRHDRTVSRHDTIGPRQKTIIAPRVVLGAPTLPTCTAQQNLFTEKNQQLPIKTRRPLTVEGAGRLRPAPPCESFPQQRVQASRWRCHVAVAVAVR